MVGHEDLAARLREADTRWSTVRGTVRMWRDHTLTTRAFMDGARLDQPAAEGSRIAVTAVRNDAGARQEPRIERVLRVYAAERGRRRRAEILSRAGEEWMADLVVIDEPWCWARTGDGVWTNHGAPSSTDGGADFVLLLTPAAVPDGFALTPTGATETVAGRSCDVVIATPKESDPYEPTPPGAEVFDMISGGRHFRLHVDRETSTLMRAAKLVDGESAEVVEFLDIVFDEPLDQSLFRPLTEQLP